MDDQEQTEPTAPRKRSSSRKTSKPRKRKTPPPNNVQPGAVHEAIAAFLLDALRARTTAKVGVSLNVGDLSEADKGLVTGGGDDGREPVELLARILAHIGHRIPFFSKVEKRLEGKEAKSGLASDLAAFLMQLWHRNKEAAPVIIAAAQRQQKTPEPNFPTHPDPFSVTDVTHETVSPLSHNQGG